MNEEKNIAKELLKKEAKKRFWAWAIPLLVGALPLFLGIFVVFVVCLAVLGMFDFDNNSGSISKNYSFECNYEETKVVVMDGSNTKVLATVSLEDYIIGVACGEIGACNGASSYLPAEYIKAQYVASKTYVLSRGNYNSSTKTITIKASTRDQQWCDLESGCIVTKELDTIYQNTYPGNYSTDLIVGDIIHTYSFTEGDLTTFHQYYKDTYGDLLMDDNFKEKVFSMNGSTTVQYKSTTQNFWKSQATEGLSYEQILKSTASANVSNSTDYANKSIYKLGAYCKAEHSYDGDLSNINVDYVKWMIEFANDNTHGYSMDYRTMNPDVDCSSFVYYALLNNGYTTAMLGNTPFGTGTMENILLSAGFEKIPFDVNNLQVGDIVWLPKGFNGHVNAGHTEVYVGDGKTVGAHNNYDGVAGDSSGKEVSVVDVGTYKATFRKKGYVWENMGNGS